MYLLDMRVRQVESTIPGLQIRMQYCLNIVQICMQYCSKTIRIHKGFRHVPYVRVRRKSASPLEQIRRKYCGPAPADLQKKVRIRSSGSAEKSMDLQKKVGIRSSRSAEKSANSLEWIRRKKSRPTRADPLKKHGSTGADPQ